MFAGIMVLIAGTLNCIWGIAANDGANFFVEDQRYILSDLNTMRWIILRRQTARGLLLVTRAVRNRYEPGR